MALSVYSFQLSTLENSLSTALPPPLSDNLLILPILYLLGLASLLIPQELREPASLCVSLHHNIPLLVV